MAQVFKKFSLAKLAVTMRRSHFARNVLFLMVGSSSAQLVLLAVSPILTRLYTPDDLGLLASFSSTVALIGFAAAGKYEQAIVLPRSAATAYSLARLSLTLSVFCGILALLALVMLSRFFVFFEPFKVHPILLWLTPISVVAIAANNLYTFWLIRIGQYKRLSVARLTQSISSSLLQLSLGFAKLASNLSLIGGQLVGQLLAWFLMKVAIDRHTPKPRYNRQNYLKILAVARRYQSFPRHNLPAGILTQLTNFAPIFFFGTFYSAEVIGLFALAQRAIRAPLSVLGGSAADVFLGKASELARRSPQQLRTNSIKMTLALGAAGFVPCLVLVLAGPRLFSLVFGPQWAEAGVFSRIMAMYLWMQFAFFPLSRIFNVLERQKIYQNWEWSRFTLCTLSCGISTFYLPADRALLIFSLAMVFSYTLLAVLAFRVLAQSSQVGGVTEK